MATLPTSLRYGSCQDLCESRDFLAPFGVQQGALGKASISLPGPKPNSSSQMFPVLALTIPEIPISLRQSRTLGPTILLASRKGLPRGHSSLGQAAAGQASPLCVARNPRFPGLCDSKSLAGNKERSRSKHHLWQVRL